MRHKRPPITPKNNGRTSARQRAAEESQDSDDKVVQFDKTRSASRSRRRCRRRAAGPPGSAA